MNIKRSRSPSGVLIADDFRDNLIIDRYDPVFTTMRASKKKHMRSENSEDVMSWNVFRSLRQIDPETWLPLLTARAFSSSHNLTASGTTVELWKNVSPPPALLETGDEGVSEIDIVIENPRWVWFIEAKLTSDISSGTTTRPARNQVLRNIDVGSYYAGVRGFYFSLLIKDSAHSPEGLKAVQDYRELQRVAAELHHRPDGVKNCLAIGVLTWADIAGVMDQLVSLPHREHEAVFAERCQQWLKGRLGQTV